MNESRPEPFVVNVFQTLASAEQAVANLLSDWFDAEQVATITGPEQVPGLAASLIACGVSAEMAVYYSGEVDAGRALVAVRCHGDDVADVRTTLGRHGGSVRIPGKLRDGTM